MAWQPCACCRFCGVCASGQASRKWQVDLNDLANGSGTGACGSCTNLNGSYVLDSGFPELVATSAHNLDSRDSDTTGRYSSPLATDQNKSILWNSQASSMLCTCRVDGSLTWLAGDPLPDAGTALQFVDGVGDSIAPCQWGYDLVDGSGNPAPICGIYRITLELSQNPYPAMWIVTVSLRDASGNVIMWATVLRSSPLMCVDGGYTFTVTGAYAPPIQTNDTYSDSNGATYVVSGTHTTSGVGTLWLTPVNGVAVPPSGPSTLTRITGSGATSINYSAVVAGSGTFPYSVGKLNTQWGSNLCNGTPSNVAITPLKPCTSGS